MAYQNRSSGEGSFKTNEQTGNIRGHNEIPNPYVLKGDGWVPDHIVITSREVYTLVCLMMTLVTIVSIVANSTVIVTTWKFKVNGSCLHADFISLLPQDNGF